MTVALTDTARVAAKLLAHRATRREEIPALLHTVHAALATLATPPVPAATDAPQATAMPTPRRAASSRKRSAPAIPAAPAPDPVAPAPRLVRRAEVIAVTPVETVPFALPSAALRGVVKWFDAQARRGALRLPGHAGDVPVDAQTLSEMGITRLYKGQEVEATVSEDAEPRILRLTLPGGSTPSLTTAGIVHSRHAKPVVVELKREALRRAAARAEAELLLRPERAR